MSPPEICRRVSRPVVSAPRTPASAMPRALIVPALVAETTSVVLPVGSAAPAVAGAARASVSASAPRNLLARRIGT